MFHWINFFTFIGFTTLLVDGSPLIAKDKGNKSVQKFYFNEAWNDCLAFVVTNSTYNIHIFDTPVNCPTYMDIPCAGLKSSVSPVYSHKIDIPVYGYYNFGCKGATCPEGYTCATTEYTTCCDDEKTQAYNDANKSTCPDGSQARGYRIAGSFYAVFGETCDDLICAENEKCIQINRFFAKCCETVSSAATTEAYEEEAKAIHGEANPNFSFFHWSKTY